MHRSLCWFCHVAAQITSMFVSLLFKDLKNWVVVSVEAKAVNVYCDYDIHVFFIIVNKVYFLILWVLFYNS